MPIFLIFIDFPSHIFIAMDTFTMCHPSCESVCHDEVRHAKAERCYKPKDDPHGRLPLALMCLTAEQMLVAMTMLSSVSAKLIITWR